MKKRRRFSFWEIFEELERDMLRIFHEMMKEEERLIEDLKKGKGHVYGFQITIGPDGKPIIKEFGDIKPSIEALETGEKELYGVREPLTDVYMEGDELQIVAEMPGVKKEDIKVKFIDGKLEIKAEAGERKYYKKVRLPAIIDEKTIKATYKNGILEIKAKILKKEEKQGKEIKIE